MHQFEIWAPNPQINAIDVMIGDTAHPMSKGERGVWSCRVDTASPGTEYGFRLNHNPSRVYPDPRSRWQPNGVHGRSALIDHAFEWTDGDWQAKPLDEAVLYEFHIGTFTPEGTYAAAQSKLPYLKDLGITHIEMMPLNHCSGKRNWGYDGVYLYAPYAPYGSPQELKAFVNACHQQGLAIILDVVYNHFGPEGNYIENFGPYFKDEHTPWGGAVNFDGPGSDFIRSFVIDNALMWLDEYHFDGLRIDAMDELKDQSPMHIMEELSEKIAALSARQQRPLIVTAEFDRNDPRVTAARSQGGFGLDAQWCDNFHHALMTALSEDRRSYYHDYGSIAFLAKALRQGIVFDGQYSEFRDKRYGRPYGDKAPSSFIVFSANHDQIGNRPLGDRPTHRLGADRVKIASALTILSRFVPMIFQGEEWDASTPFQFFTDHEDQNIAEATVTGRGESFADYGLGPEEIPNPQQPETMQRSSLNWSEKDAEPHRGTLEWHRRLIALRHSIKGFGKSSEATVVYDEERRWLVMSHSNITVACNLQDHSQFVPVENATGAVLMSSPTAPTRTEAGFEMPPYAVAILCSA